MAVYKTDLFVFHDWIDIGGSTQYVPTSYTKRSELQIQCLFNESFIREANVGALFFNPVILFVPV